MQYTLNDKTVSKFAQFGINVFGIDPALPPMVIAKQGIDRLSAFLFDTLGLSRTLTEIGIGDTHFPDMAQKAEKEGTLYGFQPLAAKDVENIYRMCL